MKSVFFSAVLCFLLLGCYSVEKVTFKTPVDTSNRKIIKQAKKIYSLKEAGVFASNTFEGARLNGFEQVNDSTAQVIISPENTPINNSAYYAFKTWSSTSKVFYFTFKYPPGFKNRYMPKLKINNQWSIIDSTDVFIKDSIITIKLQLTKIPITVAAQEVQSSKDVEHWYTKLIEEKENRVYLKNYGKTPLGKKLAVLNIYKNSSKGKDIIVLLTRQHPPEVTGYYAFQYFLETILSDSDLAKEFLNRYHVLAFPLLNPDGVDLGNWRHNSNGVDTNRDWSEYHQPEIEKTVKYIQKTLKKNNSRIVLGLDFHSTWHDVFYTNKSRTETTLPNFIEDWFAGLEANIPNYKVNEAAGNSDKPVSKGWFLYGYNAVGITYEIGDKTPKNEIQLIGETSAEQMMKILLKEKR
jgi:flagellar biogenesis protein FliO